MSTIYYNDVLAESLAFGKRRELATLEATNRRIHGIIDRWLSEAPFLVFDLKYKYHSRTSAFRRVLVDSFTEFVPKDSFPCEQELYITGAAVMRQGAACKHKRRNRPDEKKPFILAFNANLQTIPRYLRFHYVDLSAINYINGDFPSFQPLLKQFVPAFSGCILNYESKSSVDGGAAAARNNAIYLDFVTNYILPLAPNAAAYEFDLSFNANYNDSGRVVSAPSSLQARSIDTTLVSSILHLSPIEHSKHLSLDLDLRCSNYSTRLPIATIKNWLFRSLPVGENSGVGSLFMHISLLGRIENITDFVDAIQSEFCSSRTATMPFEFQLNTWMGSSIFAGNAQTLSNTYTNEQLFIYDEEMEGNVGMLGTIKKVYSIGSKTQ